MIKIYQKDGRNLVNIDELQNWSKNPKTATQKDLDETKDQLTGMGQHSPLLVMPDGTVLGGNQRLIAMREAGLDEVWISLVEFKEENEIVRAYVNWEKQPKTYTDIESAKLEYALSHNHRTGSYVRDKLNQLVEETEIDTALFNVDFSLPKDLDAAIMIPDFDPIPSLGEDTVIENKEDIQEPEPEVKPEEPKTWKLTATFTDENQYNQVKSQLEKAGIQVK